MEKHVPYVAKAIVERISPEVIVLSDVMSIVKLMIREDKVLQDFTVLEKGDYFGDLHLGGIDSNPDLELLSPYVRANEFLLSGLSGLVELSECCIQNDPIVKNIKAFRGISDILRPNLVSQLGIPKENLSLYRDQQNGKKELYNYREEFLKDNTPLTRDIYELWLSRDEVINSYTIWSEIEENLFFR